jgi:hypothetical protein
MVWPLWVALCFILFADLLASRLWLVRELKITEFPNKHLPKQLIIHGFGISFFVSLCQKVNI